LTSKPEIPRRFFVHKLLFAGIVAAVVAVLAAVPFVTARAADDAMPTEGQMAPTFTLPSQEGTPISLDQYRGKWVVLYFYPKDMTTGCTIEAHKFQDALPQFEAKNAVILGVSVDTVDSHKQFCTKDGLTFHLLADPDHKVVSAYGSLGGFNGMVIAQQHVPDRPAGQDRQGVGKGEPEHVGVRRSGGDSVNPRPEKPARSRQGRVAIGADLRVRP
jgi:thioredoxin-dependent peroxiredoxin